ncbi:MAG TPA: TIGR02281 family clan AA aspartic protease [Pseudolabrys sp.]|nr:TIGR02281 family clan AA aspartic protease [Pseudolabrys sp.]
MRQLLIFAAAALVGGSYIARYADKTVVEPAAPQAAAVQAIDQPTQVSAGQHRMELSSGRDGHFRVDARIDGRHIDFMVDTGASLVILRESDAAQVGLHPMPRDYTAIVSTANGRTKAAPAKLDRIEVGDITVFDVPALIMPDDALSQNLLGVAFLSRLRRYEYADGRMLLEQ